MHCIFNMHPSQTVKLKCCGPLCQVPFGEVSAVKNWLKISGVVYKPRTEHPKRPISGFDCTRSEVLMLVLFAIA